jgi:hypothetical protein
MVSNSSTNRHPNLTAYIEHGQNLTNSTTSVRDLPLDLVHAALVHALAIATLGTYWQRYLTQKIFLQWKPLSTREKTVHHVAVRFCTGPGHGTPGMLRHSAHALCYQRFRFLGDE